MTTRLMNYLRKRFSVDEIGPDDEGAWCPGRATGETSIPYISRITITPKGEPTFVQPFSRLGFPCCEGTGPCAASYCPRNDA